MFMNLLVHIIYIYIWPCLFCSCIRNSIGVDTTERFLECIYYIYIYIYISSIILLPYTPPHPLQPHVPHPPSPPPPQHVGLGWVGWGTIGGGGGSRIILDIYIYTQVFGECIGPYCEWIGPDIEFCRLTPPASKINFAEPKTRDVKTDAAIYISAGPSL